MSFSNRKTKYYILAFRKHDFSASITVFLVALPLCLGIALASNAPVSSGIIAGIIGGLLIPLYSKSELSVSGPAAGLTSICVTSISQLGSIEAFFLSVAVAGILQILLGILKLGAFTHFIPSVVIKGMLSAIGILLISKQIPLLIGYDKPDFWSDELINIITLNHAFTNIQSLMEHISIGAIIISIVSLIVLFYAENSSFNRLPFFSATFLVVVIAASLAALFNIFFPSLGLDETHFINLPKNMFSHVGSLSIQTLIDTKEIWTTAVIICFAASLETLLSTAATDKLDPYNRVTPQNRELVAQGIGNLFSGILGGLPITAVIVRSSANIEARAKTRLSAFFHGIWLLLAVIFAISFINYIPYSVLAVILVRTGYNLAKPKMIISVYKQGREQFLPFVVTFTSILLTDLLIGVAIGICYTLYFLIKYTYSAGFKVKQTQENGIQHYVIELALNVSFLNKKPFIELLDTVPRHSVVEIIGSHSVYIDHDVLEIFQEFKSKAKRREIVLTLKDIPEVEIIEIH